LELQLEDLVTAATEDELAAQAAAEKAQTVRAFTRVNADSKVPKCAEVKFPSRRG
jgi:hypothetical protein